MPTAWELYLADKETPPYSGWPGAFDIRNMPTLTLVYRPFLIVTDERSKTAVRVIQGPRMSRANTTDLLYALRQKMEELVGEYALPDFDIASGLGTIKTIIDDMFSYSGWNEVQVEELEV